MNAFLPVDRVGRADRTLGSRQLAAMLPDAAGTRPAYRHLAQAISTLILDGRIALHVRLPAERELAAALDTSRTTVTAVYDLLRESGYAHSRQGSGTWTALPEGRTLSGITRLLGPQDTAIDLARASPGLPQQALVDALVHITPQLAEQAHTPATTPTACPTCAPPSPSATPDGASPPCRNRSW
ncbi:GntR family transcriptional regulator [Streptomyces aureus]